ncbi:MAG: thiamine phosphate synthase [Sorangiineae bacterium]|nr:thiamine phosphate synthase [Polyangiaceae bacterium]MEB2323407.1 thiamine phosphate synthase [Sorangiineae bacterium]
MRELYAIIDLDSLRARGLDPRAFAESLLAARPPLVQLRAKQASPRETLELLAWLRERTRAVGARLFANDRPDLALAADCDGVHVGQHDLPVSAVRRIAPGLAVGVSTHTVAELEAALAERPDYVAFGPIYATRSKANPDAVIGVEGLARAAERARRARVPLCAIGGIDAARLRELAPHAELVAVIGALLPRGGEVSEVAALARGLMAELAGAAS